MPDPLAPAGSWTAYLEERLTPQRVHRFRQAIAHRTRWVTVVLEDVFQPHNAAAVLRSCECFGVQDVHVVEARNRFLPNQAVDMGASGWLTLHRHPPTSTEDGSGWMHDLRRGGYRVVATSCSERAVPLSDFPLDHPIALVFGTEEQGLSTSTLEQAEAHLHIPMQGLTQSLNVSVSVALCLFHLLQALRRSALPWPLPEPEQVALYTRWLEQSVPHPEVQRRHWESRRA